MLVAYSGARGVNRYGTARTIWLPSPGQTSTPPWPSRSVWPQLTFPRLSFPLVKTGEHSPFSLQWSFPNPLCLLMIFSVPKMPVPMPQSHAHLGENDPPKDTIKAEETTIH